MLQGKADDGKTIRISLQLYDELRKFCDRMDISFLDFVEDALETATYRHELQDLLNDQAKIDAKIEIRQHEAHLQGFERGVLASFAVVAGQMAVSQKLTPRAVKEKPRYKVVTGEQMELF